MVKRCIDFVPRQGASRAHSPPPVFISLASIIQGNAVTFAETFYLDNARQPSARGLLTPRSRTTRDGYEKHVAKNKREFQHLMTRIARNFVPTFQLA